MEYISTGNLPHVFHKDNVKISDNNTTNHLIHRPENNELYKLDQIINCIPLNINHCY